MLFIKWRELHIYIDKILKSSSLGFTASLGEGVVEIIGHTQFHGDILMTLNQPACGVKALIGLVYCLKTFFSRTMWLMDHLFERCSLVAVTVRTNKALIKHSLFSLYAHTVVVIRLHFQKKINMLLLYMFKIIFQLSVFLK